MKYDELKMNFHPFLTALYQNMKIFTSTLYKNAARFIF